MSFTSAISYIPSVVPTTKDKQRNLLSSCIRMLMADPYVTANFWRVLLDLAHIRNQMHNRHMRPRARSTSAPVTPQLAARVLMLYAVDPSMPQHDIAYIVGTNVGRVNEILNGKRV